MRASDSPLFRWRDAVADSTALTSTQKHVALVLSLHMNGQRVAYPKVETIARRGSLSTRSVQLALRALERAGFLQVLDPGGKGPSTTTRYRGCFPGERANDLRPSTPSAANVVRIRANVTASKGERGAPEVVREVVEEFVGPTRGQVPRRPRIEIDCDACGGSPSRDYGTALGILCDTCVEERGR